MVQKENRALSYMTTAWFLEQIDKWFDLMSSQHSITALSTVKMEEYQRAISFLQDIVHLFRGIKIGPKGWWKPVQSGVIMATTSILAIHEEMLSRGHKFVLTSRFTQDCVIQLCEVQKSCTNSSGIPSYCQDHICGAVPHHD